MGVVKRRRSRSETEPIRMIAVFAVHLSVFPGWYSAQCIVWSEVIIVIHKFLCYFPYFVQGVKQVSIQNASPVSFVKPFNVGILCWFAGNYVFKRNSIGSAPLLCYFGHKFGPIVHPDGFWFAIPVNQVF